MMLKQKRSLLTQILRNANLASIEPQGGYFMLANLAPLFTQQTRRNRTGGNTTSDRVLPTLDASETSENNLDAGQQVELSFMRELAGKWNLIAIPASVFYSPQTRRSQTQSAAAMATLFPAPTSTPSADNSLSTVFRFCFIKSNSTFEMLERQLRAAHLSS